MTEFEAQESDASPMPAAPAAATQPEVTGAADGAEPAEEVRPLDLDAIAADLADVEIALARLDNGTYWTDEVTGEPLPDSLLSETPIARRLPLA